MLVENIQTNLPTNAYTHTYMQLIFVLFRNMRVQAGGKCRNSYWKIFTLKICISAIILHAIYVCVYIIMTVI